MKTAGGKVRHSSIIGSSNSVSGKLCEGDDSHLAMLDEEFFGNDLPPNFKISRLRTPDSFDKRKAAGVEAKAERALWDEEFLGHRLPPNYVISRFRTPERLKKKIFFECGLESKGSVGGGRLDSAHRRAGSITEDIFEYKFDRAMDSYVLSEEVPGGCNDFRDKDGHVAFSTSTTERCTKAETFEERALRFGAEDWNLVCEKQVHSESKVSRPTRRLIFHSPSGSDTSSLISTLESSSFSCGSEGSSFARTEFSSSSFNVSQFYSRSGGTAQSSGEAGKLNGIGGVGPTSDGQFVELTISGGGKSEVQVGSYGLKDRNFLQFNFCDGKMVESNDFDPTDSNEIKSENFLVETSIRITGGCATFQELTTGDTPLSPNQSPAPESLESENLFDSSQDSNWSGPQSVTTTDQGPTIERGMDPLDFEDDTSNYNEDQPGEDWGSDTHSPAPLNPLLSSSSRNHIYFNPAGEGKVVDSAYSRPKLCGVPAGSGPFTDERSGRSPKNVQVASRKARSLGSVLSRHLAFSAVPSLRCQAQRTLNGDRRQKSPSKVSAACIEWLWSERGSMKSVQALRTLADSENPERKRIGVCLSPPEGNLEDAFRESRTFGMARPLPAPNKCSGVDNLRETDGFVCVSRDLAKESRDSILASWAAVDGPGESAGQRARQPSAATRSSLVATSLRQGPKRGLSPRKRSFSFGAQAGSKPATSLTKPVPRNLALELEVLCRPFGPVLKGVRFLPVSKRTLGRVPLFSKPQLTSGCTASSTSSADTLPPVLKCGRLQSVLTRDGLPSYSLIMDDSEEIFIAKTLRVDVGLQEGFSHLYTFHSYKGKGKVKNGWRKWGRKEKPCSDFAGNMTVLSTIRPLVSCSGVQNFVESEFVLFDATVHEVTIPGPTSFPRHGRSSFSSWDTVTPQRSPRGSSTYSSPSSACFSLPSPESVGALSTTVNAPGSTLLPSPYSSLSGSTATSVRFSSGLDNCTSRPKHLERHSSLANPLRTSLKMDNCGFHESVSDSETADECDSRRWVLSQTRGEFAAVVVRTLLDRGQGKAALAGDKGGWGINFLRKNFDNVRTGISPERGFESGHGPNRCIGSRDTALTASCELLNGSSESCNSTDQTCRTWVTGSADELSNNGGLSVTLILPAGEHGCSTDGLDGPQPLIERWKSGGKCDCGSWDLGCGLTILGNQSLDKCDTSGKSKPRDGTLRLHLQGKQQLTVGLALAPSREGCHSLRFRAPISPLHAFATAVAVLHSRDPLITIKKVGETRRRMTRIPVKVVPTSSRSISRQVEESIGSKSVMSSKIVCPNPPPSPFARS